MIPLGSNKTFEAQDITSPKTLTFDALPVVPIRHRIWFEINLKFNDPGDEQRTLTIIAQKSDDTVDYYRRFPTVVDGAIGNYNQVPLGPMIVPASEIIKLSIASDLASDDSVDANVRMLSDDAEYIFHHYPAENGLVALSPASRLKAIYDLVIAGGDGDLAKLVARLGAFTGTGVNTVLGFFQNLMRKSVTTASDIGGTYDHENDSLEAIRDTAPLGTAMRGTDSASTHSAADVVTALGTGSTLTDCATATGFSTHTAADVDTELTASHGAGDWNVAGGATPAEIDTELTTSHGAGDWNVAGGATVNILPLAGDPSASGRLAALTITAYQHTKINATISITDSDGDPVDLSAKSLALIAWHKDTPATTVLTMLSEGVGAELSVGGDDNNQVTIAGGVAHTATAQHLDWRLYNLTDVTAVATGVLKIEEGAALPV